MNYKNKIFKLIGQIVDLEILHREEEDNDKSEEILDKLTVLYKLIETAIDLFGDSKVLEGVDRADKCIKKMFNKNKCPECENEMREYVKDDVDHLGIHQQQSGWFCEECTYTIIN